MAKPTWCGRMARAAGVVLALCACDGGGGREQVCTALPTVAVACALPLAVQMTVASAVDGGPVANVAVAVTGAMQGPGYCSSGTTTTCDVWGPAGEYTLAVSAPGYQSQQRVVQVAPVPPQRCGCGGVATQKLTVALTPQP